MRLLFISKIETNAGWGFETFLNAALQKEGIETVCLDFQKHRYHLAQSLLEMQEDFDGVLVQRGRGYSIPSQVLQAIRRPRFFVFTELLSRHPDQYYMLRDNLFDHVFLRSQDCIEFVQTKGWLPQERVGLFLSAIDPAMCAPLSGVEKDIDVLFVGSMTRRRERILAELQKEMPVTVASAFGQEMMGLVNRAKIVLNLHAEDFLDTETRVYEVLACGGFLITEKLSRESPFLPDVHLAEVAGFASLRDKIVDSLAHPEQRQRMAEAGRAEVIAHHTIEQRARQLHEAFSRYITGTPHESTDPFDRAMLQRAVGVERLRQVRDPIFRVLGRLKRGLRL